MTGAGQRITAERLEAHVRHLAGTIGERHVFRPRALEAAVNYITAQWTGQDYDVVRQTFEAAGRSCANLEVTREGTRRPAEILLVGAHYDTVPGSPGANDNASGVAALLELSRRFAGMAPARTVRFVAFANEEPPFFMTEEQGSVVYAGAARGRADAIRLMLALETMGCYSEAPGSQHYPPLFRYFYPRTGNFLGFVTDLRSRRAVRRLVRAYRAVSDFPVESAATFRFVPGVSWSDHHAFWRQGYPAVMVTDTAFYRYGHYHAATDTPDKLSYRQFADATEGLCRALARLADDGG